MFQLICPVVLVRVLDIGQVIDMRNILVFILPLMLMSGCLSSGESTTIQEPIVVTEEVFENHSHQFWGDNPMSIGNKSIITFNNSGNLYLNLELSAYFHEPISWEQGWVNYSLIYENETVWSVQSNNSVNDYTFGIGNMTGDITIQIRASGSHNATSPNPGDFFIAKTHFELIY